MSAKTPLILTLLASLLFAMQVPAMPERPLACVKCTMACCADKVCCTMSGQPPAPRTPAPVVPRNDAQLVAIEFLRVPFLYALPATERAFVILDEARAGHALPPRLAGCIRLI